MTPVERVREKEELLFQLGMLFRPLLNIIGNPGPYDVQARTDAVGRYCREYPQLDARMRAFSDADPERLFSVEAARFHMARDGVYAALAFQDGATLESAVPPALQKARAALANIPITLGTALPAQNPFSAYLILCALCAGDVSTELVWLDPHVSASVFYRYLDAVPDGARVALVTEEPRPGYENRWKAFLDVSRIFATERGAERYRLVTHAVGALHERYLRIDGGRHYMLGGSSKDAGTSLVQRDPGRSRGSRAGGAVEARRRPQAVRPRHPRPRLTWARRADGRRSCTRRRTPHRGDGTAGRRLNARPR